MTRTNRCRRLTGEAMAKEVPDFLVVGHVTLDLLDQKYRLGGSAFYAALTAEKLGLSVGVFTSGKNDVTLFSAQLRVQVVNVPSSCNTVFENIYRGENRIQYVHSVAPPVPLSKLPEKWKSCPLVLLAPVANEVDVKFAEMFGGALLGISVQGWLRQWKSSGKVSPNSLGFFAQIGNAHVVFLSREDVSSGGIEDHRDEEFMATPLFEEVRWPSGDEILVMTEGSRGALVRSKGRIYHVPAFPSVPVDVTGAGDVFAGAFMVRYKESGDPQVAGLFASAAASVHVEEEGGKGMPTREQVEEKMSLFPRHQVRLVS